MMKPACELALLVVGCILLLAQRCPIVGQVVGVLGKFSPLYFSRGNQMSQKVIFPPMSDVGPSVGHTIFTAGVKRNAITHDHLSSCVESKDGNASGVVTITKEVATITKEIATITKEVATITKLF